ncbi:hypothetical protein Cni_G05081 [Canna indica]|uniref:U-box domain-containing protein n=1 Tax=Canna indica TaxID=4628 RepID=A0AAQ3JVX0_9LILI|nr:hypothetical protein Cni_G05081 [Canna indica]
MWLMVADVMPHSLAKWGRNLSNRDGDSFLLPLAHIVGDDEGSIDVVNQHQHRRWIFNMKQKTCLVTKQPLVVDDIISELTPNHTLARLIQAWCTLNSSHRVQWILMPRLPVDKACRSLSCSKTPRCRSAQLASLRKLKQIAAESERNKRCIEVTPGIVDFLASIIVNHGTTDQYDDDFECASAINEALVILHMLEISEEWVRLPKKMNLTRFSIFITNF